MEPILYTVKRIDGDYAVLIDEKGEENRVAMALLPWKSTREAVFSVSISFIRWWSEFANKHSLNTKRGGRNFLPSILVRLCGFVTRLSCVIRR